jgi:hypothetical protein
MAILCSYVVISNLLDLMMNYVSNVTSAREYIVVDGMANNDLFQGNPIPNQCGVKRLPGS